MPKYSLHGKLCCSASFCSAILIFCTWTPIPSGALAKLDIHSNYYDYDDGRKGVEEFIVPIATMRIKEIDISGNFLNAEAARIFSQAIQDNGVLAKLTFRGDSLLCGCGDTLELGMTEGDFSRVERADAIILASWIEHK